jgi:multidrug efflux pump subunit AcrB
VNGRYRDFSWIPPTPAEVASSPDDLHVDRQVALQRPYTFIMLAVLIVFLGVYSILKMPTDIFPNIKIPIAAVIWRYTGLLPEEMANRIVLFSERTAQTVVNDVEHTESQSVNGTAVVKYFFQPNAESDLSMAQIIAVSQTQLQTARRARRRRSFCPTTPRASPSCSSRCRARPFPSRRYSTSATTSCARSWRRLPAPRSPIPTAASSARCRSTWIRAQLRARGLAASDVVNAISSAKSHPAGGHRERSTRGSISSSSMRARRRSRS